MCIWCVQVRRSLAFSIHVMALMLGPDIMMADLVPIFDGFLNDLDDVKAGILRHFSHFLRLLPPGQPRESYLGRLAGTVLYCTLPPNTTPFGG